MSILSFDIGIKNLCFCELDKNGKILDWSIVNISNDVPCEHKMKNGKCCDKPGTYIYKCKLDNSDMYLCTSHSKNKCYDKVKKFKNCYYRSLIDLNLFNPKSIKIIYDKYNIQYKINPNIYDCEHRYFHLNAIKNNNVKLFIYNKNLFPPYIGEHTNILN